MPTHTHTHTHAHSHTHTHVYTHTHILPTCFYRIELYDNNTNWIIQLRTVACYACTCNSICYRINEFGSDYPLPPEDFSFDVNIDTETRRALRSIQRLLVDYKESHHGPTIILVQTHTG